jgi:rubrerythrin
MMKKAMDYIRRAELFCCHDCGIGFLRIRRTPCPFCKSENTSKVNSIIIRMEEVRNAENDK